MQWPEERQCLQGRLKPSLGMTSWAPFTAGVTEYHVIPHLRGKPQGLRKIHLSVTPNQQMTLYILSDYICQKFYEIKSIIYKPSIKSIRDASWFFKALFP